VRREPLAQEGAQLGGGRLVGVLRYDDRLQRPTVREYGIGTTAAAADLRVRLEHRLDLERIHLASADIDEEREAARDREHAVRVEAAESPVRKQPSRVVAASVSPSSR
jgi:hypothetical protein